MTKYFNIILLFISISLLKVLVFNTYYLSGHDAFQYTYWAESLFTENYNLTFFRPVLYAVLLFFIFITDHSPYYFYLTLLIFFVFNFLLIIKISKIFQLDNRSIFAILSIVFLSHLFLIGDANNIISTIELFFILILFYFYLLKNNLGLVMFHISGFLLTLVHEDKFLLYFLFFVLTLFDKKKNTFLYFIISVSVLAFVFSLFGLNSNGNALRVAGSVSFSWNNHLDLIGNALNTTLNSVIAFNPIFSLLFMFFCINIIKQFIQFDNFYYIFKNYRVPFVVLSYQLIIGILFAGIELPRTTAPVLVLILFYLFIDLRFNKKVLLYSTMFLFVNVIPIINYNKNIHIEESRYYHAYNFIKNNNIKGKKIYLSVDFENRVKMWGSDNKYGLKSNVYDTGNEIILEISEKIEGCPDIVFYKNESTIFNKCIYNLKTNIGEYNVSY